MTVPLELIARLQNEASPAVRQLIGDLGGLDAAAERASVSISRHEMVQRRLDIALARSDLASKRLADAQARLAANTDPEKQARFETAVKSAEIAVKQQSLSVDRLKNELVQLDQANDRVTTGTQSFGQKLTGVIQGVEAFAAGVVAAGAVAKQAFDFAEEGAQLEFIESRFEVLAESIGSTSDRMLESLNAVTRGTMTTAEQMEIASQIINLGLAKDEDSVVRLANVVTNLGLDMQQVIMTFANDSKMRLDALGLSVTDVEARTKSYTDTGMAMSEAFDLAVLDALEDKLELVGSAADSDVGAFLRLRTAAREFTDELKRNLAEGLTPWIQAAAGDYQETANAIIENNVNTAQSIEDLIAEGQKLEGVRDRWYGLATAITGTETAVNDGIIQVIESMAKQADSSDEFMAAMDEAFGGRSQHLILQYAETLGVTVEGIYNVAQAAEELQRANEEEIDTKQQMIRDMQTAEAVQLAEIDATREQAHSSGELGIAQEELNERFDLYNNYLTNSTEQLAELTAAQEASREKQNALNDAFREADAPITELMAAQAAMAENGVGAAEDLVAANQTISDSYRQVAVDALFANTQNAESAAQLAVQLGLISQAEADLRLNAAETQLAIEELAGSQEFATMTAEEQARAIEKIIASAEQFANSSPYVAEVQTETDLARENLRQTLDELTKVDRTLARARVQADTDDAVRDIRNLAAEAEAAAGTYNVHYSVTSDPIPTYVPGGGNQNAFSTGGYTGDEPGIAGFVHGREYVFDESSTARLGVPFLENLRRGNAPLEQLRVFQPAPTTTNQSQNITIHVDARGSTNPQETEAVVSRAVHRALEKAGIKADNYRRVR